MQVIYMVIADNGDGSQRTEWVKDKSVIDKMNDMVNNGTDWKAESYMSGDGLQVKSVKFPDDFDIDVWVKENFYGYTTLKDLE